MSETAMNDPASTSTPSTAIARGRQENGNGNGRDHDQQQHGQQAPSSGRAANGTSSGSHARSHSVPGGSYSSRGRGGSGPSSSRGRGGPSGRGGSARGGGRGGHASGSQIPVKSQQRPPMPPPQPSVHLDSVDEFPALGGPSPTSHSATTASSPSTSTSTPSSASADGSGSASDGGTTSLSRENSDQTKAGMKASISFARIVAPTPPASAQAQAPEAAKQLNPAANQSIPLSETAAAAVASASAPSSRRVSRAEQGQQVSGQQQRRPSRTSAAGHPHPHGHGQDPLAPPEQQYVEQPHFSAAAPGPGPVVGSSGLTPVQIAFLQANGLAVEGLPQIDPNQAFDEYYAAQQQEQKPLGKKARKAQREWEAQQHAIWQQQQQQDQGNYHEQQPQGQGQSQGMQKSHSMGSFHFSADAPAFQPHASYSHSHPHSDLNVSAPVFQPKSPLLNGSSSMPPHEEPIPEVAIPAQTDPQLKEAAAAEQDDIEDAKDRAMKPDGDLPNGTSQEAYEADERPKEGLKMEDMPTLSENGAEPLEARQEEAVPEQTPDRTEEMQETESQASDLINGSAAEEAVTASDADADVPASEIAKAAETFPDRIDRLETDLPAGTSQEAYGQAEASLARMATGTEAEGAEVLVAQEESEALPEQAGKQGKEEQEAIEQVGNPAADAVIEDEANKAQEEPSSPPHSTFSLLPPVSVGDVLDKAKSFVGLAPAETEASATGEEAPTSHDAKANIDELDLPVEQAEAPASASASASAGEAKANIDELDLPTDANVAASTETLSNLDELDLPSEPELEAVNLPEHAQDASFVSHRTEESSAKHSLSPSEVEQAYMSAPAADGASTLDDELASARSQPAYEIVSSSQDRCSVEASEADALDRSVRSMAPSPQAPASALPEPGKVDIVVSPSSPAQRKPSTPPKLAHAQSEQRPAMTRSASEAEKAEAIRIVAESRSQPPTPAAADEAETSFKFDLPAQQQQGKRKRAGQDAVAEDEESKKPKREQQEQNANQEAPSLTMSIFSGSILPRGQMITAILASVGINLFLPFVNGVMLGFGEIIARDWIGPLFGFGRRRSETPSRFSTASLGLRSAGNKRGGAQDVPGHAGAKTLLENATETAVSGSPL